LYVESEGPESSVYTLVNPDHISHDAQHPVALSSGFPKAKAPARVTTPVKVKAPEKEAKTPAAKARAARNTKIKDLFDSGKTYDEIAEMLGVSKGTISNVLRASAIGFGLYDDWEGEENGD
jgi:DNA-binding NarL/FixJ family response regulator